MKRIFTLFVVVLLCSGLLFAFVIGGSNLGYMGYPDFSSYYPSKPFSYNNEVSEMEFDRYRDSVQQYVDSAREYVKNGNNDIQRISEAQEEAINKANEAIDEFNSWARSVTITSRW